MMKKINWSHFQMRRVMIPLLVSVILSFLYNLVYLISLSSGLDWVWSYGLEIVDSLLSSLALYFICTLTWGWNQRKKAWNMFSFAMVLGLQAVYIFLISGLLSPLYFMTMDTAAGSIVCALISAVGIICMIPFQLVYYYGLFTGIRQFKALFTYIKTVWKLSWRSLLNWFCALLLLVIAIDSLWWGMFSLQSGFIPVEILTRMLYCANPMFNWMMYLFSALSQGYSLGEAWIPVFVCFIIGFFYGILELNYVLLVQRRCEMDGTEQTEAD